MRNTICIVFGTCLSITALYVISFFYVPAA